MNYDSFLTEDEHNQRQAEALDRTFEKYGKTDPETGNRVLTIGGDPPPLTPEEIRENYARRGIYY